MSKSVSSPATADGAARCQDDEFKPLNEEEKRLHERIVATSCLASAVSSPSIGDMRAAKRVGRHLRKALVALQGFPFHDPRPGELLCFTDAYWASDKDFSEVDEWRRRDSWWWSSRLLGEETNECHRKAGKVSCSQPSRRARDLWGSRANLVDLWYNCSVTVATDSQSVIDHSRRRGHSVASKHVGLRGLSLQEALENRKLEL